MSQIAPGSLHKYLTGETVTGDDTQVATNLNIVFETIRLALNDADTKVNNTYTKAQIDALNYTKAQVDAIQAALVASLNTHKTSADHDGRYYTETEIDGKITTLNTADTANTNALTTHKSSADHDGRYYTETEIDGKIATLNGVDTTNANNLNNHKTSSDHDSRYYTETELGATDFDASGAKLIGVTPIATSPANLQGMVEWLKNQIDSAVVGTIPDASINKIKLHPEVTTQLVPYSVTTGSANTYAVALTPAPSAYTDGMPISFKVNVDANAASSLNVNSLGAKNIVKANGAAVTNLKANGVYTVRYNLSTGNFILQGEGGGGTATNSDLRVGKTAVSDSGDLVGTMPNSTQTITPSNVQQAINAGYHDGTGKVNAVTFDPAALLTGYTVAGTAGTMAYRGNMSISASSVAQTIPKGFHEGGGVVNAVTFDPWNLLSGVIIAGTAGLMVNKDGQEFGFSGMFADGSGNLWINPNFNGYVSGSSAMKITDPDFIAANIPLGVNMFGLAGTLPRQVYYSSPTYRSTQETGTPYRKLKGARINVPGTMRCSMNLVCGLNNGVRTYGYFAVNDVQVGTTYSTTTSGQGTQFTLDITVNAGDEISVYARPETFSGAGAVRDFLIMNAVNSPYNSTQTVEYGA